MQERPTNAKTETLVGLNNDGDVVMRVINRTTGVTETTIFTCPVGGGQVEMLREDGTIRQVRSGLKARTGVLMWCSARAKLVNLIRREALRAGL